MRRQLAASPAREGVGGSSAGQRASGSPFLVWGDPLVHAARSQQRLGRRNYERKGANRAPPARAAGGGALLYGEQHAGAVHDQGGRQIAAVGAPGAAGRRAPAPPPPPTRDAPAARSQAVFTNFGFHFPLTVALLQMAFISPVSYLIARPTLSTDLLRQLAPLALVNVLNVVCGLVGARIATPGAAVRAA